MSLWGSASELPITLQSLILAPNLEKERKEW